MLFVSHYLKNWNKLCRNFLHVPVAISQNEDRTKEKENCVWGLWWTASKNNFDLHNNWIITMNFSFEFNHLLFIDIATPRFFDTCNRFPSCLWSIWLRLKRHDLHFIIVNKKYCAKNYTKEPINMQINLSEFPSNIFLAAELRENRKWKVKDEKMTKRSTKKPPEKKNHL